ncbi:SDR family NAD(P)-dependent oxidoreductase [Chitinophaga varians]|uniref:SDR family NAD(P)-dependent oxidoreductase n=1 Tax=Chitinophaga varians TaxID=2202339 RepID=UPI00165EC38D|nr:SDR family NAD(P)-dependent oxidoreductase [Chitinophaga varians]MBC9915639.1 SDR family NAD(P)-dependent oxidoreductase [Chitinophaga varians]
MKELLLEPTEGYLRSLISKVAQISIGDSDTSLPFQELGIDSFRVLQIIKKLEEEFGTLPKTLLFENFNIGDLSHYFVKHHEQTISAKFALEKHTSQHVKASPQPESIAVTPIPAQKAPSAAPILISEQEALAHPEWSTLVADLFTRYKNEGSASRGTRNIAPHLFIGSEKKGYFNYSRYKQIVLVYAYTGPMDYYETLSAEIYQHCTRHQLELNLFSAEQIKAIGNTPFTATPFGVLSRISNIREFSLEGGSMRRLRYQVTKFAKEGQCRTVEYRNGSDNATDAGIAAIIDKWCAPRTMVNPLIFAVKEEILAGRLSPEHRLFLTYLDDVLLNVILISKLSGEQNGYLMDLEFYPQEMPLGGLEYAIVHMMGILAAEGCDVLSLGGTYGCKLEASPDADPALDKMLDFLRENKIFNDEGNLQFKNKFRPDHTPVFLCRAVGSNPDNVTDIIMMIADPDKMQTTGAPTDSIAVTVTSPESTREPQDPPVLTLAGVERADILAAHGYNPFNIPDEHIDTDLKTDSWAQLDTPAIRNQVRFLHSQLQQPANLEECLRSIFPFSCFAFTTSGRTAEHTFFKSWKEKGVVIQNLLFPTTIFNQIDNGFTPEEWPHPEVFQLHSRELYRGNLNYDALQQRIVKDAGSIAMVLIEIGDNAAGGAPVSMQHLREVKALLSAHHIPLVFDGTRMLENARFIIANEKEFAGSHTWDVVREMLSYADAVIAGLTKDFCVSHGGMIATNDTALLDRVQDLIREEGTGLDVVDKKILALSLQHRDKIEAQIIQRMESVQLIGKALQQAGVPVLQMPGGHCILIDVKQIPAFSTFKYPVASFIAWMFLNTGIRAGAHSAGMRKETPFSHVVRLAIPVGTNRKDAAAIAEKLIHQFESRHNIPELLPEGELTASFGDIHSAFKLLTYHNVTGNTVREKVTAPVMPAGKHGTEKDNVPHIATTPRHDGHNDTAATAVAIVGMAGRYPKAKNVGELWKNLVQGMDCIETIPHERFEQRLQNKFSQKYRGGFLDSIDKFDSLFFNISPREAEHLDPQERLFLEVAWETIEDAGYYPETLVREGESRNIGVYVGAVWTLYQVLGLEEKLKGNNLNPSSHLWGIANRVSYAFNLSGPSMSVDTACSSSLTAIHLACEAICKGECSGAIVGGVNLDVHQGKIDINRSGGALSPDGVGRAFGKGANGYVAGEGVGAVYLKPLARAVADGDHIYGVIRGTAVNHGGKTSGFMVPSPNAQARVVMAALENAKVDASHVTYIEAHGTGTELGDPVEISGLTTAFQQYQVGKQNCAVGTIKTNIGHLEAAAGIVGLQKVLLQMKHCTLVPSLHSAELNPFIDFENSPFYVGQTVEAWTPKVVDGRQLPLYGGISSFGAGGSNAHVIIEQYCAATMPEHNGATATTDHIFPLSARNEEQLRAAAIRLMTCIREDMACDTPFLQLPLNDIAHTLQTGRKSFDHRLAIIAGTKAELVEKLAAYIDAKSDDNIFMGQVKGGESITKLLSRQEKEEFIKILARSGDLRKLAQLWIEGLLSGWQGMGVPESGRKVSLPTYPFADKRHWISGKQHGAAVIQSGKSAIHPLIDSNESTFGQQLFKKTFHEGDFFIYDHLVSDIPTLPGVAYLDFARKAGELAAGRKVQKIRNIIWLSPLTVVNSVPREVLIELKPNGEAVNFEVFSEEADGRKQVYSQGKLIYATNQELSAAPEYIDINEIRERSRKVTDGKEAYPLFKSLGLALGPSFQVLQDIFRNDDEILGALSIPDIRQGDFHDYLLHPSLVDGSFQAGMAAQLGASTGEMFVPYSIGEVEVLQPLTQKCFSYVRKVNEPNAKVSRVNVFIVDESGKVLVKIRESVGVPLVSVHEKPDQAKDEETYQQLHYAHEWQEAPLTVQAAPPADGPLLLFAADEQLYRLYKERFKNTGEIILVLPGEAYESMDNVYRIHPQQPEDFRQLFTALNKAQRNIGRICFAWPAAASLQAEQPYDETFLSDSLNNGVYAFLTLCQSLIEHKLDKVQLLYLYTGQKGITQPHHEAINGFVKTLLLEQPKLQCKILEIRQSTVSYDKILDALMAEYHPDAQQAMTVRYDDGKRAVRKVKAFALQAAAEAHAGQPGLKEKGVYIITGGVGGLGLIFARRLAEQYKARLVLTGRSALSDARKAELEELRAAGAEVMYIAADVSRYSEVEALLKTTREAFGEINGIIHSAGVIRDAYIRNKTREEMEAVFAPKVYGTRHLDEATKDDQLDFFVTFSSLAAVGGNVGQSDYAFANHFMDAFAGRREYLRQQGERTGVTVSLNWSLWAEGGMRPDEQTTLFFKKNLGIKPLDTETGLQAFEKGLHAGKTQFVVVEGVQEKIERTWGIKEKEMPAPAPVAATGNIPADGQADTQLFGMVQDALSDIVMELLKLEAEDMSFDKILLDLGFDSIGLTTYANRINEKYRLEVTPVLFFEYPSIREIASYLVKEQKNEILAVHRTAGASAAVVAPPSTQAAKEPLADNSAFTVSINKGWEPGVQASVASTPAVRSLSTGSRFIDQPIAIVGMSGVMPGSKDLEEFWHHLEQEKNLITVIPPDRWRWEDYDGDPFKEKNKTNSKWGGFMGDVDKFDPLFFGISPREAEMMDPQQRIFLETVWKTIEDAGHKVSDLSGTKTGLFVGVATRDYADILADKKIPLDGYSASGNSHSVLVNRVSFLLNLRGPSAPLDTACSSSLIAIHRAIESIHTGSSDMAIVGGVQLMLTPAAYISFGMAGMLSGDGKCKTFDKSANGYVRGEGSGAILLKPLDKAIADKNHIYAVIRATTENHGGRVTMLTAPNPVAQTDLLVEAYEKAQIDPATVGYIECHGTGTSLGDPIEVQALNKTFSELYKKHHKVAAATPHCGLSSVKTNIGHLETAAGIAGVLKVLLSLKYKKIPATLHFHELNPYINLKGSPLYIVDKTTAWQAVKDQQGNPLPRRAGVSSFGFGGANAHVILEEYIPKERAAVSSSAPHIIVLSAKNEERLNAYAQLLYDHVGKQEEDMTDLAFTLQMGRDEMTFRLALLAGSGEELQEKLARYLSGEKQSKDIFSGKVTQESKTTFLNKAGNAASPEALAATWLADGNYTGLAEAWVSGISIGWEELYRNADPRRISLPTYPFARERYWFSEEGVEKTGAAGEFEKLHPLLHVNASVIGQQSYHSVFTGKECFIADHQIAAQPVLPLTAYLEMVCAAVENALPDYNGTTILEMRNTTWREPLVVADSQPLSIALLEADQGEIDFEIYGPAGGEDIMYCSGRVWPYGHPASAKLDIAQLKMHFEETPQGPESLYQCLDQMGMAYGPSLRSIQAVYRGDEQLLVRLRLPPSQDDNHDAYTLHPAMMEGAMQAVVGLLTAMQPLAGPPLQPFEVASLKRFARCDAEMYAWVRYARGSKPGDSTIRVDIDLTDITGKVGVKIKGLAFDNSLHRQTDMTTDKDFEMLLNVVQEHDTNGTPYAKADNAEASFDKLLQDLY